MAKTVARAASRACKAPKKTSLLQRPLEPQADPGVEVDLRPAFSANKQAWENFKALSWPSAQKEGKAAEYFARPNESGDEDYSKVFLSHARLYAFAFEYEITRLKALTLKNLHRVLVAFTIFDTCAQDIAELLSYSQGYREPLDGSTFELHNLVNNYVACHIRELI
ncbi:hypothetical protein CERZMDRAFT_95648 [Cercospora zeae-maydis SCOH1-5]|uniref:Uncharacterized protein n=1 Tax=Cercospora zeae-maydis SCOH1-5 TaxID=717836 RepID=A0A6A6FLN6_9PEZI|nr:hypothetical protein CERZMDRAFT_95648 [Cercospora zeae-maydis SCOH1-5]